MNQALIDSMTTEELINYIDIDAIECNEAIKKALQVAIDTIKDLETSNESYSDEIDELEGSVMRLNEAMDNIANVVEASDESSEDQLAAIYKLIRWENWNND